MSLKLTPDELGDAGESNFKLLCSQAKLVCNKSSRDLTGWDFIVEFPMTEPGPAVALDQRPTAACHVQLKSTAGESTGRVALRLSAIERLAKDVRPALIVVFRLRSDGEGVGGYVVHLLGEQLARVLKRLRAAQARKAFDVNQASISFDYRKVGTKFALTPEGLRDALISVCGNDPARYVVEKQRQLDELGYENGRLEAEALVWLEGPEHLNNILLGLIPLKPTRLRAFDSRFGIRIPYVGPLFDDIMELTIAPPHVGNCDVSIRGPGLTPAAVFTAEMYIGPPIEAIGGPQLLIRHPDFTLKFRADGMNFETTGAFDISLRPLQRWTELIRALSHMATGRGVITIFESGRFPRITLPVEQPIEGPCIEQLPQLAQFLDGWQKLLSMAGVKSSATFSMEEICDSPGAGFAVDVLCNPVPTAYFEFQTLGEDGLVGSVDTLYFNNCKLGDAAVSYSVKVTLEPTNDPVWRYRSTSFTPLDVRPAVDDIEEYGEEQAAAHGLKILINPNNVMNPVEGNELGHFVGRYN